MIMRSQHPYFDHACEQILVSQKIPSMDNLVTRLLQVPTSEKDEKSTEVIEISSTIEEENKATMVDIEVGMDILNAHTIRAWSYPRKLLLLTLFPRQASPYV